MKPAEVFLDTLSVFMSIMLCDGFHKLFHRHSRGVVPIRPHI